MRTVGKGLLCLAAVSLLASAAVGALPFSSAAATVASATLSAGSLAFINGTPATTISFPPATRNGTSQTVPARLAFDIGDATGSGAGWDVTATSTTFTSGANALPTTATTLQSAPSAAGDTAGPGCSRSEE